MNIKSIILGLGLSVCVLSSAHANNGSSDDIQKESAQSLSKMKNIPYGQALKIIKQNDEMGEAVAEIRETLRGRVAGIYAEYQPEFTLVVRLKGEGSPPKKAIQLASGDIPIKYITGQKYTVEELTDVYNRNYDAIKKLLPTVQGIGLDEKNGKIIVSVLPEDGNKKNIKDDLNKLLGHPADIQIQDVPTKDANLRGGAKVSSPSSYCTSGFVVKNTVGTTGIATAAHCEGINTHTDFLGNNISLNLVPNTELYNYRQDVEIHTGSKTGVAEFYGSSTSSPTKVIGRISRDSTYADMPACHRGATTGYSCGLVQQTNYKPTYTNACGSQACDSTWVTVVPDASRSLACYGGDSGGSVFNSQKALGLLKGTSASGSSPGQCNFYIYMTLDYLPAGWSVLYGS